MEEKKFTVTYVSRYYPLEGNRTKIVKATSKKEIRDNWHNIILTDEYKIKKIDEVKS